jgi:hypothetical protein
LNDKALFWGYNFCPTFKKSYHTTPLKPAFLRSHLFPFRKYFYHSPSNFNFSSPNFLLTLFSSLKIVSLFPSPFPLNFSLTFSPDPLNDLPLFITFRVRRTLSPLALKLLPPSLSPFSQNKKTSGVAGVPAFPLVFTRICGLLRHYFIWIDLVRDYLG